MFSVFDFATHETYAWSWPQNINQRLISISCFRFEVCLDATTTCSLGGRGSAKWVKVQSRNAAHSGSGYTTGPLMHM